MNKFKTHLLRIRNGLPDPGIFAGILFLKQLFLPGAFVESVVHQDACQGDNRGNSKYGNGIKIVLRAKEAAAYGGGDDAGV